MLRKALSFLLAILVFIGSTGLVWSKHYCQGELKSTALFAEATPCHTNKQLKHCPIHGEMMVDKEGTPTDKGCCDTQTELVKVDDAQQSVFFDFNLNLLVLTLVAVLNMAQKATPQDDKTRHYLTYKPPPLVRDLPVSLQTFRC